MTAMPTDTGLADFARAMRDPFHPPPAALHAPGAADLARRFAVHRHNYLHALTAALAESFPVVQALVGAECFGELAHAFIAAAPPRSPVLLDHGARFPDFIAGFGPLAGLPYLADVARLEWRRLQSFHAADADAADPTVLATLAAAPERLAGTRVQLHPSAAWLRSHHALHSLWQAHQRPDAERDAALASLDPALPEDALVLRDDLAVVVHRLPPGGYAWLVALAGDATLAAAFDAARLDAPHASPDALLQLLLQRSLVTRFLIPD